jgi:glycerol-3-phosphate dehydrogenase
MIDRDPSAAQGERFDLIVVGGGIYGSLLALESARRGLRPLLLERDDFGQHTSGSWLGILHGGLRYLQRLDVRRHRESVTERAWWLRTFPDLVRPLPCVMPLYDHGLRRRSVMRAALAVDRVLVATAGLTGSQGGDLPRSRILSGAAVRSAAPMVDPQGLVGGALWYDAVAARPERLIIEVLRRATHRGATALNYIEVEDLELDGNQVAGVTARDASTGARFSFRAPGVVNCAGPWGPDLAHRFGSPAPELFRPSFALNLLLDGPPGFEGAIAVQARRRGARTYFLHVRNDRLLAGTFHAPCPDGPMMSGPPNDMIQAFLGELHEVVPDLDLPSRRVLRVLWGHLPVDERGTLRLQSKALVEDHRTFGGPAGLFSVSGVKYTVARKVAESVLRRLAATVSSDGLTPPTDPAPPPNAIPEVESMRTIVAQNPTAARELIRTIAQTEAVRSAEDLLFRRTDWGAFVDPDDPLVRMVTDLIPAQEANGAS